MRNVLLGFMMLIMLTPGLACAASICASMDRQAQAEQDVPPCHGNHGAEQDSGATDQNVPMFLKDCSGIDLAQADHGTTVKKPNIQIDKVFFVFANITPEYSYTPADSYQIRGPPFDTSPPHINNHDLYLTTQRLRI